jgi:hypothetical protein
MRKGCGCYGYLLAILAGLVLGLGGLSVAGYVWATGKVLSPNPVALAHKDWSAKDEAALAMKIAPIARAIDSKEDKSFSLNLTPGEANRLFQEYLVRQDRQVSGELLEADDAFVFKFSRRVKKDGYLNGELRCEVSGSGGKFTAKALSLKAGRQAMPDALLPELGHWIEGALETQKPFQKESWRVTGISRGKGGVTVDVKTVVRK